jgi:hypothetical protein
MHKTLVDSVKGHIDNNTRGWCFHSSFEPKKLRFAIDSETHFLLDGMKREDVSKFYRNLQIENCGWVLPDNVPSGLIEMLLDGIWTPIYSIEKHGVNNVMINPVQKHSLIIVDNFYEEPDKVREIALQAEFSPNDLRFKGQRSKPYRFPGLKEVFEKHLGCKITNWENKTNGCFQYCIAEDKSVYHCDLQEYAAIIYLTPDAPVESGTQIYRSKLTKKTTVDECSSKIFPTGFYDSTKFESVDTIGNIYNRLILFHSKQIHAAPVYFGNTLENSRLFQIFFFDVEKP